MRRLPLELLERLRALRPTPETPKDHVGFVATAAGVYFLIAAVIEVWRFLTADIILPVWRVVRPWLFAGVLVVGLVATAQAAVEARCTTLGANCICSEPLNTNSYVFTSQSGGNAFYNPADTTGSDKQCTNETGPTGSVLLDGSTGGTLAQQTPVNSGEAWTALPAGHSLSWILKQNDESNGQSLSHKFATSDPTARRSYRFYRYYSAIHNFSDDTGNGCNSGKLIQIGWNGTFAGGPLISMPGANMYDVNTSNPGGYTLNMQPNCCTFGPGGVGTPTGTAAMKGKWWRFEFAFNNAATGGSATYFEGWMKDVTTGGTSEIQFLDTRVAMTSAGPDSTYWWQSPMTDALHVSAEARDFAVNMFRSNNGTVCTGHIAHTHGLWAAWSTSAGQRIGAAVEVEGAASSPHGFILRILLPLAITLGAALTYAAKAGT